jgi:hypothetical protein
VAALIQRVQFMEVGSKGARKWEKSWEAWSKAPQITRSGITFGKLDLSLSSTTKFGKASTQLCPLEIAILNARGHRMGRYPLSERLRRSVDPGTTRSQAVLTEQYH